MIPARGPARPRPFDPRLARYARSTRRYLAAAVALGAAQAVCIVAQAALIGRIVAGVFVDAMTARQARPLIGGLLAVAVVRAVLVWASEVAAHRASAAVKSELRGRVLERFVALGPAYLEGRRSGDLAMLVTRGVDALDAYFSRYLPQLILAAVVPAAVLAWVLPHDRLSAIILATTLPLVPVFGILVGLVSQQQVEQRWDAMAGLGGRFLDLLRGLPTLKAFRQARAQREVVLRASEELHRTTMATLRVAFLSAFVLELLAASATALVAAAIGLRLVAGSMTLGPALAILILTPEVYAPIRAAAAQFHASTEGLGAAARVFEVLEAAAPSGGGDAPPPDPAAVTIRFEGVDFAYPGRGGPVLDRASFEIRPGERVAVVGESGAGKSTILSLLLRFATPRAGRILAGETDLADVSPDAWRDRIAWVPQRTHLFAGTIAENIRLGNPDATGAELRRAATLAGALPFIEDLPSGFDTPVGEGGEGLSGGERQRIALARAFLRDAPLVLLDEPTAHLDATTAAEIETVIARLSAGRTVMVVAHHPGLALAADRVLHVGGGLVLEQGAREFRQLAPVEVGAG